MDFKQYKTEVYDNIFKWLNIKMVIASSKLLIKIKAVFNNWSKNFNINLDKQFFICFILNVSI